MSTMAPRMSIQGRYVLYKEGTTKLTRWLASTASSLRRSAVKETANSRVSTKDLLRWAELIAFWNPPVDIPASIVDLTQEVIVGRTMCADFYTSQGMACEGHEAFIQNLEKILTQLKAGRARRAQTRKQDKKSLPEDSPETQVTEVLSNLFDMLQVEEPSQSESKAASSSRRQASRPKQAPSEAILHVGDEEEGQFALWCLLKDFHELRTCVRNTWSEVTRNEMSFSGATTLTEIAFDTMRRGDEELVKTFPSFRHYPKALASLNYEMRYQGDEELPTIVSLTDGKELPSDKVEMLNPFAAGLLSRLHSQWRSAATKVTGGHEVRHAPSKSADDLHRQFSIAMHETFGEWFTALTEAMSGKYPQHRVIGGFAAMQQTGEVRLWLVSAFQVYMDIFEVVPPVRARDVLEFHVRSCLRSELVLQKYVDFLRDHPGFDFTQWGALEWIKTQIEGDSLCARLCWTQIKSTDVKTPDPTVTLPPLEIWRRFPAMLGQQREKQVTGLHASGVQFANMGSLILSLAHIYKAARGCGLLPSSVWADMEWFVEEHGKDQALVQDVKDGSDLHSWNRHYMLACGITAVEFAKNPRSKKQQFQKDEGFRKTKSAREFKSPSEFERLNFGSHPSEQARQDSIASLLEKMAEKAIKAQKKGHMTGIAKHGHTTKITSMQLLETFKTARLQDDICLHFDYFSFWMACCDLATSFAPAIGANARAYGAVPDQSILANGVLGASDIEMTNGVPLANTDLANVAQVMKGFIDEKGDLFTKEARSVARNVIPSDWPEAVGLSRADTLLPEEQELYTD